MYNYVELAHTITLAWNEIWAWDLHHVLCSAR